MFDSRFIWGISIPVGLAMLFLYWSEIGDISKWRICIADQGKNSAVISIKCLRAWVNASSGWVAAFAAGVTIIVLRQHYAKLREQAVVSRLQNVSDRIEKIVPAIVETRKIPPRANSLLTIGKSLLDLTELPKNRLALTHFVYDFDSVTEGILITNPKIVALIFHSGDDDEIDGSYALLVDFVNALHATFSEDPKNLITEWRQNCDDDLWRDFLLERIYMKTLAKYYNFGEASVSETEYFQKISKALKVYVAAVEKCQSQLGTELKSLEKQRKAIERAL